MAETALRLRFMYWTLFLGLCAVVIFVKLLPLDIGPGRIPGPDVLVLMVFAWVLRRPDFVPVPLVAAVFLAADMLFMRPPGLWTALVIIGLEILRGRDQAMREGGFLLEWLSVAALLTAMFLAQALILMVFLVHQPALGLTLLHAFFTVLAYPVVVALAARLFGLRRMSTREAETAGRKR